MKRTDELGIEIGASAGEQGYWAFFNGEPCPPDASAEFRAGWDECDDEIAFEKTMGHDD